MPADAGQRVHDFREVFDALRWLVRDGASWRMMPHDLPPWEAVYQQTQRWIDPGVFEAIVHDLRELLRLASGRAPEPSAQMKRADSVTDPNPAGAPSPSPWPKTARPAQRAPTYSSSRPTHQVPPRIHPFARISGALIGSASDLPILIRAAAGALPVLGHRLSDSWPPILLAAFFCPRSDSGPGKAAEIPAQIGICVSPQKE